MKAKTISLFFALSVLVTGMIATSPTVYAEAPSEVTIEPVLGSGGSPACNETDEGCYSPMIATVAVGGTVTFVNSDVTAHTFTAGSVDVGLTNEFDSGLSMPDSTFEFTPTEVGEIEHFCIVHAWMSGVINVVAAAEPMDDHGDGAGQDMMMEKMLSDGESTVAISTTVPTEGMSLDITVMMNTPHSNYDIITTQNDVEVLNMMGVHAHNATTTYTTDPLPTSDPVDITLVFQGYGLPEDSMKTGPVGEEVTFMNVIPELDTIVMMMERMLSDGESTVAISTTVPTEGMSLDITVMMNNPHSNYDIITTQNDVEVLNMMGVHAHNATTTYTTDPLPTSDPVDITLVFQGYGLPEDSMKTGPVGEEVTFMNVIPEFGTIAMMILAVAIISIVAVTAKTRIIPRF